MTRPFKLTDDQSRHLLMILDAQIDGYAATGQRNDLRSAKAIKRRLLRAMAATGVGVR